MPIEVTQRNQTRNQSTADYNLKRIAIFDNRFTPVTFKNNTGASASFGSGILVLRDPDNVGGVIPAIAGATLANVIGILVVESGPITLADAATVGGNIIDAGTVDGTQLTLPAGVTLDTIAGSKSVEDHLNALGIHVDRSAVEMTKYDN